MSAAPAVAPTRVASATRGANARRSRIPLIAAACFVLLLAWETVARVIGIPAFFPDPLQVAQAALGMLQDGSLLVHMKASLYRILLGFGIGCAIAIPIGILMGNVAAIRHFCEPYIEFFRYIPALSLVTVSLIWFGLGEASKVFLIVYATTFIVVVNTLSGVRAIPPIKYRAAQALGVTGWKLFAYVSLPATVPFILTGMRIAMGNAFAVIVAAEMIGAQEGLGYLIVYSRLVMRTDVIFVAIITLGLLGLATDQLFRLAIHRFGRRYNPHT
jgi:ABC-type nitrate/sulfonate/bicarbonate transport system permease component